MNHLNYSIYTSVLCFIQTESVQKLETRYRDRDTNFIDELVAERERLVNENTKLSYQVQHLEELQVCLKCDLVVFVYQIISTWYITSC